MSAESTERQEIVRECIEGINVQQILDRALSGFNPEAVPLNNVFMLVCRDIFTQVYCRLRENGFQMEKKDLNPTLSKLPELYPPFIMILNPSAIDIRDNVYLEVMLLTDENGLNAIERLQKIGMEAIVEGNAEGIQLKVNGLYEEARGKGRELNLDDGEVEKFLDIFNRDYYMILRLFDEKLSDPKVFLRFLLWEPILRAAIDGKHTSVLSDQDGLKSRIKEELEKWNLLLQHHERGLRDILSSLKVVGEFEDYQETDDLITAFQKLYIASVIKREIMRVPGGCLVN